MTSFLPGAESFTVCTWPGLGPTCFSASPRTEAEDQHHPVGIHSVEGRPPAAEPFPWGIEGVLAVTASAGDLPF